MILSTDLGDAELDDVKSIAWDEIDAALTKTKHLERCFVDFQPSTGTLAETRGGQTSVKLPQKWALLYHAITQSMPELRSQNKLMVRVEIDPSIPPQAPPAEFWAKATADSDATSG